METECDQIKELEAGVWTVNTNVKDAPPGFVGPPHNRMAIFLLDAAAGGHATKSLALVNGVHLDAALLADLRALEQAQGAKVRYVVSTGDWHHVFLGDYVDAFPEANMYIPPGRIENLPNLPDIYNNFTVLDIAAPLAELRPHLHIQNMDGLIQPQIPGVYDENSTRNELFFYHPSTKTLIAGDLFWLYSCEPTAQTKAQFPGAAKGTLQVWHFGGGSIWGSKPEEIAAAKVSAQDLLNLDFTRYIALHGSLGNIIPPDAVPNAKAQFDTALKGQYGILPAQERFWM